MSTINKTIKIRILDGKPFYILRATPLIRACEMREEFHKQMISIGAAAKVVEYSRKMIFWNKKMIELIRMNQEIKEQEMPLPLKKELVEINEKILNQLNHELSPTLYKWLKPRQYKQQGYRLIYIEFHDERPPEVKTHEYQLHKFQRLIELMIRNYLNENEGVPSLKFISIFSQYRELIGEGSEHSYSHSLKHNFQNHTLLD